MNLRAIRLGVFGQLALLMGGLAAVSTTVALVIQDRTLSDDLRGAATVRLNAAATAANRLMDEYLSDVADRYAAVSATPELRANLAARDQTTLAYYARRLHERQRASFIAFQSPDGSYDAIAGDAELAERARSQIVRRGAAFVVVRPQLFAVTATPLFIGDERIGQLVAGEPVGPDVLNAWSAVLGTNVSVGTAQALPEDALVAVVRPFPEANIQVTTTYEAEQRAIQRARRNLALSGLIALLVAVLASVIAAHSFARPIRAMKRIAERVGNDTKEHRLDFHRSDELGDLGRAFDDMLDRLRESETRLARAQRLARFTNWSLDVTTNAIDAGRDFRRLFGIRGRGTLDLDDMMTRVHPDDQEKLMAGLERVRTPNGAFRTDVRVPLRRGRDRILHLRGQRRGATDEMTRVEASVQDVTERWHSERQIQYLSLHDSVTGLGNRQYLFERLGLQLKQAERSESCIAVLFIGLEGFASVDGIMGHRIGDEVLCEVGRRLVETLGVPREHDRRKKRDANSYCAVRFGNAEFAAVDSVRNREEASSLGHDIVSALEEPYVVEDQDITLLASVGLCMYPDDGATVDTLVSNGQTALQTGRTIPESLHFYHESMHEQASRRIRMAGLLRRAIENDELEVHYQPRVRPATGEIVAVEALARWNSEQLGPVSPAEFIPVAEDAGLVQDLGEWSLRSAVRDLVAWQSRGAHDLRVSVNLSPQQLQPGIVDRILDITADIDPGSLEFEVTEGAVIRNPEEALSLLTQLSDHGFRIALDDFGTGYSSLSYIRQLPIHAVKIDQSFIKDLATNEEALSITWAVIMMCQAMNLESVAEGVETEQQREQLADLGCDEIQGYLFSRPIPFPELEKLLASHDRITAQHTVA